MLAVRVNAPHMVEAVDLPKPRPEPGFARIRVKVCAICATDLEIIDGNIPAKYPIVPGHEWSGVVDAVGSPEDASWLGRPVTGSNDVVCLRCDACRSGNWRYCKDFEEIGFKRDGAYAEYVSVPVYGLCEKPDNVPFEQAALCEPLGVALGTMRKAHAEAGETVLIMGAGSIGLCMLAAARASGMRRPVVCASSRRRLNIAKAMGAYGVIAASSEDLPSRLAEFHPEGTDLVIDCTGTEECVTAALRLLKKGGTLALAGYGRGKVMSIRVDDIHINNLRVVGAGNNWNMHKSAMKMIADGAVDLSRFISARLSLSDYAEGLRLARTRPENFVKAVFVNE